MVMLCQSAGSSIVTDASSSGVEGAVRAAHDPFPAAVCGPRTCLALTVSVPRPSLPSPILRKRPHSSVLAPHAVPLETLLCSRVQRKSPPCQFNVSACCLRGMKSQPATPRVKGTFHKCIDSKAPGTCDLKHLAPQLPYWTIMNQPG